MEKIDKSDAEVLRKRAEELLTKGRSKSGMHLSEGDSLKLIHELEVYQIELEMLDEELKLAKAEAQDASNKYTDLNELHQRLITHFVKYRNIQSYLSEL